MSQANHKPKAVGDNFDWLTEERRDRAKIRAGVLDMSKAAYIRWLVDKDTLERTPLDADIQDYISQFDTKRDKEELLDLLRVVVKIKKGGATK